MDGQSIEPERWASEAAVDRAVESRRRRHHLESQLSEETGLAGVLRSSVVRGARIELSTTGPGIAGTVVTVGGDHLALDSGTHTHLVALAAVTAVHLATPIPTGAGAEARADHNGATLTEILSDLRATDTEVHLRWAPDGSCRGTVTSVGPDVVTVSRPGSGTGVYHVVLAHLVSVTFAGVGRPQLW